MKASDQICSIKFVTCAVMKHM